MAEPARLREPFRQAAQQREADMMGMYVFLASEVMLFGGLFVAIFAMRMLHPQEVVAAARRLHVLIGAFNTAVLLTSSLAVALGVHAARQAKARQAAASLGAAAALGLVFLAAKGLEYAREYQDGLLPVPGAPTQFSGPVEHLFMSIYVVATGLHAVHVTAGIVLLSVLAWRLASHGLALPQRVVTVELAGLYWHLVDVIWVFLYPALYLAR